MSRHFIIYQTNIPVRSSGLEHHLTFRHKKNRHETVVVKSGALNEKDDSAWMTTTMGVYTSRLVYLRGFFCWCYCCCIFVLFWVFWGGFVCFCVCVFFGGGVGGDVIVFWGWGLRGKGVTAQFYKHVKLHHYISLCAYCVHRYHN